VARAYTRRFESTRVVVDKALNQVVKVKLSMYLKNGEKVEVSCEDVENCSVEQARFQGGVLTFSLQVKYKDKYKELLSPGVDKLFPKYTGAL
jgi:hypothetical protein